MSLAFHIEKQWLTKEGYIATVIMTPMGHRCGYITINKNHPGAVNYDDRPIRNIDIHGGLTYSQDNKFIHSYPIPKEGQWTLGFDAAHLDDAPDYEEAYKVFASNKKVIESLMTMEGIHLKYPGIYGTIKGLEYMVQGCNHLSEQLEKLEGKVNEY